jgi:hypothetical protein
MRSHQTEEPVLLTTLRQHASLSDYRLTKNTTCLADGWTKLHGLTMEEIFTKCSSMSPNTLLSIPSKIVLRTLGAEQHDGNIEYSMH